MKDNDDLIKLAAIVILVPIVIGIGIGVINLGIAGINGIRKMSYDKKIQKGLKDGSIIEIDGQYYTIQKEESVEEA